MIALVVPGPNTLIISFLAASNKSSAPFFAAFGISTGASIWALSAILGINSIFELFPQMRLLLQVLGAFYLIYLALRLWNSNVYKVSANQIAITPYKAYQKGLLVNLSNPKSALFFGSIFSTTLPPNPSDVLIISSVIMIALNSLFWHLMLARIFSSKQMQSIYLKLNHRIHRITGAIFGTLGVIMIARTIREANN